MMRQWHLTTMSKVVLLFPGTAAGVDDQTREVIILVISPARKLLFFTLSRLTVLRFYIFETFWKIRKGKFCFIVAWIEINFLNEIHFGSMEIRSRPWETENRRTLIRIKIQSLYQIILPVSQYVHWPPMQVLQLKHIWRINKWPSTMEWRIHQ